MNVAITTKDDEQIWIIVEMRASELITQSLFANHFVTGEQRPHQVVPMTAKTRMREEDAHKSAKDW